MPSSHEWKRTIKGRASVLFSNAKSRCKNKNVELYITQEWIQEHLKRGTCEITGIPFNLEPPSKKATRRPDAPSLDRIDKNKNYTTDNTRVILWAVNCALAEYGTEEMLPILKAMIKGIEDAQKNQPTPVSTGSYLGSEIYPELGAPITTGFGQDDNNLNHHSGTIQGQDLDHRPQTDSGDSLGHGGQEMGTPVTLESIQIDGKPKPKISWVKLGGGHLPD